MDRRTRDTETLGKVVSLFEALRELSGGVVLPAFLKHVMTPNAADIVEEVEDNTSITATSRVRNSLVVVLHALVLLGQLRLKPHRLMMMFDLLGNRRERKICAENASGSLKPFANLLPDIVHRAWPELRTDETSVRAVFLAAIVVWCHVQEDARHRFHSLPSNVVCAAGAHFLEYYRLFEIKLPYDVALAIVLATDAPLNWSGVTVVHENSALKERFSDFLKEGKTHHPHTVALLVAHWPYVYAVSLQQPCEGKIPKRFKLLQTYREQSCRKMSHGVALVKQAKCRKGYKKTSLKDLTERADALSEANEMDDPILSSGGRGGGKGGYDQLPMYLRQLLAQLLGRRDVQSLCKTVDVPITAGGQTLFMFNTVAWELIDGILNLLHIIPAAQTCFPMLFCAHVFLGRNGIWQVRTAAQGVPATIDDLFPFDDAKKENRAFMLSWGKHARAAFLHYEGEWVLWIVDSWMVDMDRNGRGQKGFKMLCKKLVERNVTVKVAKNHLPSQRYEGSCMTHAFTTVLALARDGAAALSGCLDAPLAYFVKVLLFNVGCVPRELGKQLSMEECMEPLPKPEEEQSEEGGSTTETDPNIRFPQLRRIEEMRRTQVMKRSRKNCAEARREAQPY
jgi:hypothetical protein